MIVNKRLVKGLVVCVTWSVLVFGLLWDASTSWAQDTRRSGLSQSSVDATLDAGVEQTLHTLAEYSNGNSTAATRMLERHGFQVPAGKAAEWRNMPDARKFYYAWFQANAVSAANGNELLARMSRDMAMRYDAAGRDGNLSRYRNQPVGTVPLRFKNVRVGSSLADVKAIPNDVVRAVSTLGKYSAGGSSNGGAHRALTRHFATSSLEADRLLLTSDSTARAYAEAMKKH